MKVLVTGFEPFDGLAINPSAQFIEFLETQKTNRDFELHTLLLPVSFKNAYPKLQSEINTYAPDFVIMTGLAQNRSKISLEKVAINFLNARNADNDGLKPTQEKIIHDAPESYFTTLPLAEMMKYAEENNYPVVYSYTAGTYVCNDLFFKTMHSLQGSTIKAGFIHIPATEETLPDGPHLHKLECFEILTRLIEQLVEQK